MKKIFYTLGSIALFVYILHAGAAFLIPLTLGIFFWLFMSGQASYLEKKMKPLRAKTFIIITYVLLVCLIIVGFVQSTDLIQNNLQSFIETIQSGYSSAQSRLEQYPRIFKRVNGSINQLLTTEPDVGLFTGLATSTLSLLAQGVFIAVVSVLLLIKEDAIIKIVDTYVSSEENLILQIRQVVTNYVKGLLVLVIVVFVLYGVGLGFLGVPYLLIIAGVSALLCLIPTIGTFVGGVGATVLSGLVTGSLRVALFVALWYLIVQFVEEYFILPKIVGQNVNLNIIVSLLVVIAGGLIRGITGLFLAIPIVGVIQKVVVHKNSLIRELLSPLD